MDQATTHAIDTKQIKQKFPFFASNPDTVYLDNASTTQKPDVVVETISQFYTKYYSNAGRANYKLSSQAAKAIEESRQKTAGFFKADARNIAFTSGATESLNLIALSWGLNNLKNGDQVMVCLQDHKSSVFPWLNLKKLLDGFGIRIEIVPFRIHDVGDYDLKTIKEGLTERTRLIAVSHVHHVFGMDMEIKEIREIVGDDVVVSLDACQSAGHIPVELDSLPVDFMSCSGHKMFAGSGLGVLWARDSRLKELRPAKVGGGSITITEAGATMADLFETGTLNIPAILSMKSAIEFIEEVGIYSIARHLAKLTRYTYEGLRDIPGCEFGPGPGRCDCPGGYGIIPFRLQGIEANDLGFLLDDENILVRTGDHCKGEKTGTSDDDLVRVSLQIYNSEEDVDRLLECLGEAVS